MSGLVIFFIEELAVNILMGVVCVMDIMVVSVSGLLWSGGGSLVLEGW